MIIAIDGLDGSGKESLTNKLRDAIIAQGIRNEDAVIVHSFPDYNNSTGKQIKKILSGESFKEMPPHIRRFMTASLFAYNRAEHVLNTKTEYGTGIFNTDSVIHIFDRYWASNILYQGLGKTGIALETFAQLMRGMEIALGNPMPIVYYFLRHPYSVLWKRIHNRKSKSVENDIYEADDFQKAVYHLSEYYLEVINPTEATYDKVIEGCNSVMRSELGEIYYEKSVETLADEIIADLRERKLIATI